MQAALPLPVQLIFPDNSSMKPVLAAGLAAVLLFSLPRIAAAGAFEDGADEYRRGNISAALKDWQPLAESGNAEAQFAVGSLYLNGQGVARDFTAAETWLRKAADQGLVKAATNLGTLYAMGKPGADGKSSPDYAAALGWYRKAADKGDAMAQLAVGRMYEVGQGVPADATQAMTWLRKAAEQNAPGAAGSIGHLYQADALAGVMLGRGAFGNGVRDNAEAAKWYRIAAGQGDADAAFNLGGMYHYGRGVARDDKEAAIWYAKAAVALRDGAEHGIAQQQVQLAVLYADGLGVKQDYAEAMKWYRQAAQRGNGAGLSGLGMLYALGKGVKTDYVQAYAWLNLAQEAGDTTAAVLMAKVVMPQMTKEQFAEAQRLESVWRSAYGQKGAQTGVNAEKATEVPMTVQMVTPPAPVPPE
jgi:TPR repeat protein